MKNTPDFTNLREGARWKPEEGATRALPVQNQVEDDEEICVEMANLLRQFRPADAPTDMIEKLDMAMTGAVEEERACMEMEAVLRKFRPAEAPAGLIGRLDAAMTKAAEEERQCVEKERHLADVGGYGNLRRRAYWLSGSAAAAAVAVVAFISLSFVGAGTAVAEGGERAKTSRRVVECREDSSQGILFEDCMELEIEGTKAIIRVPVSSGVNVEEVYL